MEIYLEQLFSLNEHMNIELYDQDGKHIGTYNGKDSIDKQYNECTVIYVFPVEHNVLRIDVYVPEEGDIEHAVLKHEQNTMFASVTVYTGDCSVNVALFTSETAAKADCKKQFESTLADGKKTGDIDSDMESIWHDDEMHGTVYWSDDNVSTFEVKAFVLHDSDDINSDEI